MITKEEIGKIEWYLQAGAATPICIGIPVLSIGKEHARTFSFPQDSSYLAKSSSGGQMYHLFDKNQSKRLAQKIFDRFEDPQLFYTIKKEMIALGDKMEQTGFVLLKKELDGDFAEEYEKLLAMEIGVWTDSYFPDFFDVDEELNFRMIFGSELPDREVLLKLIVTQEPGLVQAEQKSFFRICTALKEGADTDELLEEHSRKYWFITNDFEQSTLLTADDFRKKAVALLAEKNGYETLKKQVKEAASLRREAAELKQKLAPAVRERLDFFLWVGLFRDTRKKYALIANYFQYEIAKKIAAREKVPLETVSWLLPDEVPDVIRNGLTSWKKEIEKRENGGLLCYTERAGKQHRVSGKEALELYEAIAETFIQDKVKGNSASPGKVQGTVRIMLNQSDFSRFEEGDVLVAPMTRPEYLPLMKKAAAIVTDEGGLTCHAAIVSRELGKPCIIGTQVASRVLKDGMVVKVDADNGSIKIIE